MARMTLVLCLVLLVGSTGALGDTVPPGSALITVESNLDFAQTLAALESAIAARNLNVAAKIDHAANAANAGMELGPNTVLVFGNPNVGTPLMRNAPTVGLDLPLKMLVWQASDGRVFVTYGDIAFLAARHGLDEQGDASGQIFGALAGIAAEATQNEVAATPFNTGLITLASAHDVTETLARFQNAIAEKGLKVAVQIDHAANAAGVDMVLGPNTVTLFGNPNVGTPLMQSAPTMGLDLPLKMLIWESENSQVSVTYPDIAFLAAVHGLEGQDTLLTNISDALNLIAMAATAPDEVR